MAFLRFLMLMSLVVWIGGIVLFAILAPTAFHVLPSRHLAGNIVGPMLDKLHWIGIVSAVVFLISSVVHDRRLNGTPQVLAMRNVLVLAMLLITLVSQFAIIPRMDTIRASVSDISSLPAENAVRIQFDALHAWSTRMEIAVLLLGIAVVWMVAQAFCR